MKGISRVVFLGVLMTVFSLTGVTHASPVLDGIAASGNPVTLTLDRQWNGTITGTGTALSGTYYSGYGFDFEYGGETYSEPYGFCVDPADAGGPDTPYIISSLATLNNTYAADVMAPYLKAAWVIDYAMDNSLSMVIAQAAVWEIMFNTGGKTFNVTSVSSGNLALVDAWVEMAQAGYLNLDLTGFYLASSPTILNPIDAWGDRYQDYLFKDTTPVPVPPTLILLGSALLGTAAFRRKARK